MDIQNKVTDQDTETLDNEISEISNEFIETYYFDNEQSEQLEMLVAKAMKLGELYERKKWQEKAIPEGFVLVPKLSANYLFNKVPELGFKHQDEKDTVLYHLNYMASEFQESARKFVVLDHEKQKRFIEESGLNSYRTDFQIIEQTLGLVDLLASSTNIFQRDPESRVYPFESENPRVIEWWRTACKIQELLTDTSPENCDFEEFKAMIEAQEQGHD